MKCPKCGEENPESVQFCKRCHTPVRYVCPACRNVQSHGGQCEKCGVDFTKYATLLQSQMKTEADRERERAATRTSLLKQLALLPLTGGLSLLKALRFWIREE